MDVIVMDGDQAVILRGDGQGLYVKDHVGMREKRPGD